MARCPWLGPGDTEPTPGLCLWHVHAAREGLSVMQKGTCWGLGRAGQDPNTASCQGTLRDSAQLGASKEAPQGLEGPFQPITGALWGISWATL